MASKLLTVATRVQVSRSYPGDYEGHKKNRLGKFSQ